MVLLDHVPASTCYSHSRLFQVVVDNEHIASRIMNIMNKEKLPGEITFLPLSILKSSTVQYPNTEVGSTAVCAALTFTTPGVCCTHTHHTWCVLHSHSLHLVCAALTLTTPGVCCTHTHYTWCVLHSHSLHLVCAALTLTTPGVCCTHTHHTWCVLHSHSLHLVCAALTLTTPGVCCTHTHYTWCVLHSHSLHLVCAALTLTTPGVCCTHTHYTWCMLHSHSLHLVCAALTFTTPGVCCTHTHYTWCMLHSHSPHPPQEAVPLISKLQYNSMFDPAVKRVFGKTLVCRTLETASQLAKSDDLDCVTLDGEWVESKGGNLVRSFHSPL